MEPFTKQIRVNLQIGPAEVSLGSLANEDSLANKFIFDVRNGETIVTFSNDDNVECRVVRRDGATVLISAKPISTTASLIYVGSEYAGLDENGKPYVNLPDEAYAVTGNVLISVSVTNGIKRTTLAMINSVVRYTTTGLYMNPEDAAITIQDLIDMMSDFEPIAIRAENAAGAARSSAESAAASAEEAAEAAQDAEDVVSELSEDVADLKSALDDVILLDAVLPYTGTVPSLSSGSINPANGANRALAYACLLPYMKIDEPLIFNVNSPDYEVAVWGYSGKTVADAVRSFTNNGYKTGNILILPVDNIQYIRIGIARIDRQTMEASERGNIQQSMTFSVTTDKTLSLTGKPADAATVAAKIAELKMPQFNILALGDSICRGGRNSGKGFVGDLGNPYINMGVGGATVSSVHSAYADSIHKFSDADNIPNQLISYYEKTSAEIETAFGIAKFTPDVIISDGGINDYLKDATMGALSAAPVSTDQEASSLDRNTLLGAMEYLFYQMIKLYPMAQRYFVITHKTARPNGRYYPAYTEGGGYTQQQMHDAIVSVCNLYNVTIIDVYNDGVVNTKFDQYRSTAENWRNASATDYCDYDGVHPLAYGYQQAYIPLIREAIKTATSKRTL